MGARGDLFIFYVPVFFMAVTKSAPPYADVFIYVPRRIYLYRGFRKCTQNYIFFYVECVKFPLCVVPMLKYHKLEIYGSFRSSGHRGGNFVLPY